MYTCYLIDTSEVVVGLQGPSKAGEVENTQQAQKSDITGAGGACTESRERHNKGSLGDHSVLKKEWIQLQGNFQIS